MFDKLIRFFRGTYPPSVKWEEVRREILRSYENMKVRFEVTPYYYKVTSGKKTWYWNKDTGEFDGTSWKVS